MAFVAQVSRNSSARGGDPRDPSVNFDLGENSEFEEILRIVKVRDLGNWGKLWARR
jgi:hypothetical protein